MAPIQQVGYLKRGTGGESLQQYFAVLWSGELSLFPCTHSNCTFVDPSTLQRLAEPEVLYIKGATAFMRYTDKHDEQAPASFVLVGMRSTWKAQFLAPSAEEALVWLARIREFSVQKTRPSIFVRKLNHARKELDQEVEESPHIMCPGPRSIVNWIRRSKGQDEEIVVGATAPCDPRRAMVFRRLACLKEQLKEREYLLKQLQEHESQFIGNPKIDYSPCRFSTTAKTAFCMLGGNRSTEVQSGDKIVVFGLKEDLKWRCCVDRTVNTVLSCQVNGAPGYDIAHSVSSGRASNFSSLGLLSAASGCKRQHMAVLGGASGGTTNAGGPESDMTALDPASSSVESNASQVSETTSQDVATTERSSAVKDGASGSREVKPSWSVPSLVTPDDRENKGSSSDTVDKQPSWESVSSTGGSMLLCTSMDEGNGSDFELSVCAREVSFPLIGALPSLNVLTFVGEVAGQALAAFQLAKSAERSNESSTTPSVKSSGGRIKSMARRFASSRNSSRDISPASLRNSPAAAQSPGGMRHRLSTGSVSNVLTQGCALGQDSQKKEKKFSFRRCSSASAGCSGNNNNNLGDKGKLSIAASAQATADIDSSSDEDDNTSSLNLGRPASTSNVLKRGFDTDYNMRNAMSDSNLPHTLPHNDSSSPIFRGIVESMRSGSTYDIANDDLPSQSAVAQLHGSNGSIHSSGSSGGGRQRKKRGSVSSTKSAQPAMLSGITVPFLNAWDNESFDYSMDLTTGSSRVRTVQFDWPSPGLHLGSFFLNQSCSGGGDAGGSAKKPTEIVVVTHIDECCSAYSANVEAGDAVIGINEHKMDNCSAEDAWRILDNVSSTSVRLMLMAVDGIHRLELETQRNLLDTRLFEKQFALWRLSRLEARMNSETAQETYMDADLEDSSDEESALESNI